MDNKREDRTLPLARVMGVGRQEEQQQDDLFLTYITLSDSIIIEVIKELSSNSAGGHDGIHTSLLINCAEEIASVLNTLPLF